MQKLILAVTAASMAICSNAARVNWKTSSYIGDGTSSGVTAAAIVYLIDSATLTQSSIYSAVDGGKTLADAIGVNSVASAALTSGEISKQTLEISATGDKTYYMVLFDSTIGTDGALYFSEEITKTLLTTGSANYSFASDSSIKAVAANMSGFDTAGGGWVAVPEPTSGLLLLIGMAGLALKRKRA